MRRRCSSGGGAITRRCASLGLRSAVSASSRARRHRLNVAMRLTQMAALSKNEGSHYREANTRPLCCIIFLFNQSDGRFVHRPCPIGSRLGIFRGQDGKWRKSQRKRHDRCSPNSSIWNAGARNPPAQWSLGGRADQRPRTIRARPGHRRDASSSPRIRLLGSGVGEA